MRIISAETLKELLTYDRLVTGLPPLLRATVQSPLRTTHNLKPDATLLLMPAWSEPLGGIKIVHVTPGNAARNLNTVHASYLVFDGVTHEHLALIDGGELTARRTAAVAAIAADKLSSPLAETLLLVGSGRIASELAFAYAAVRPIKNVRISSPTLANAERLARTLNSAGFNASVTTDLFAAIPEADIIACATLSHAPLINGAYLRDGQHIALIGGFTPDMREADDATMTRAQVYIDTESALTEAGDLSQPMARGLLSGNDIKGTLHDLSDRGFAVSGGGVTLFKSVGDARQDLATAHLIMSLIG